MNIINPSMLQLSYISIDQVLPHQTTKKHYIGSQKQQIMGLSRNICPLEACLLRVMVQREATLKLHFQYEKAAKEGNVTGIDMLGKIYLEGVFGIEKYYNYQFTLKKQQIWEILLVSIILELYTAMVMAFLKTLMNLFFG